jgi:two-component system, OmpR family, heavy metal sensor histidine kinase CusS
VIQNSSRRPRSIRSTIIALVTCSMVLLLAAYAYFLYGVFDAYQRNEHSRRLSSQLQFIRAELMSAALPGDSEEEELGEVREVIDRENAARRSPLLYVQVLTDQKKSLMRVSGSESFFAMDPPFPSAADRVSSAKLRYWKDGKGNHFILTSLAVATSQGGRTVHAALDWSAEEDRLDDFSRKAMAALLLAAFLSAILAATIARRALRPLTEVTSAARELNVENLPQPLDVAIWPQELAELGAAFSDMQQRLSDSFARLSQFSADLAHELRTPISNAMGEAEVALNQSRSPEEYREVIASLYEELERLSRMSQGLLLLARNERGPASLRRTTFDAREEALAIIDYYRLVADDKSIALSVDGSAAVWADRDLFRRALSNLIANAIQYTEPQGKVEVRLAEKTGGVVISVRDDGLGIAEADQPRIFDRFSRVDEARSGYPEGSGLGLSIVRSIVELHGGSVAVESARGKGSLFTLTFPPKSHITEM